MSQAYSRIRRKMKHTKDSEKEARKREELRAFIKNMDLGSKEPDNDEQDSAGEV